MAEIDLERLRKENAKGYTETELATVKPIIPFLKANVAPWLEDRLVFINKPEGHAGAQEWFAEIRSKSQISRPLATAHYIANLQGLYIQAQECLKQNQRARFYVWYTLAERVKDATWGIDRAEGVFMRGPRTEVIHAFNGEVPADAEEAALRFQRYSEILKADPTGTSLIEYQIWRTAQALFNYPQPGQNAYSEIRTSVQFLATMHTLELYKAIYPLSK